jgi:cell division protein FtsB
MSDFHCHQCNMSFKHKSSLERHYKTKRHIQRSSGQGRVLTCICGKSYSYYQSLCFHRKNCLIHQNQLNFSEEEKEEDNSNQAIREELNELKDQIKALKNNNTTQNASNIQNNTNSHNNVTININPFGQENVDMISPECFIHCLNRIYNSSPALAEQIYSYSENQNIRIPNKNKPYVSVQLENGKSKLQLLEKVLDEIENFCYTLLEEKFTDPEYRQQMSEMKQRAFENYMNAYENDDKGTVKKNIRNALKLLLLNMTEEAKA